MLGRLLDHFKSDEQLMKEETALFAQIMEVDERDQAGSEVTRLPKSLYDRQVHKLKILCARGHVTNDQGGWES
jgi:hypothetical protein